MLKVIKKEDVKVLLEQKKGGRKPIVFKSEIDSLLPEQGLIITEQNWKETNLKSSPSSYYYNKLRKNSDKPVISISKVNDGYLIVKL
jgi:hypothetical protein